MELGRDFELESNTHYVKEACVPNDSSRFIIVNDWGDGKFLYVFVNKYDSSFSKSHAPFYRSTCQFSQRKRDLLRLRFGILYGDFGGRFLDYIC